LSNLWHVLLYQPLVNALILLYGVLFHNFGLAIIVLTIIIRAIMIPLTLPSMRAAQKMRELSPELEKLKKKFKNDRQGLASAQMELYRRHGANPAAGCLPQIVQLIVLVALYQAFINVLKTDGDIIQKINAVLYPQLRLLVDTQINTHFFWLDLNKPDLIQIPGLPVPLPGLFLVASAVVQFFSSKLMSPVVAAAKKEAAKTPEKTDDMATMMQTQMLYMFPLMTILIGYSFPSGLVLYWLTFSVFTTGQQLLVNRPTK
jgi:YidC/Oxa1 family membrane protein insertase